MRNRKGASHTMQGSKHVAKHHYVSQLSVCSVLQDGCY